MKLIKGNRFFAILASVMLHVAVLSLLANRQIIFNVKPDTPKLKEEVIFLEVVPQHPQKSLSQDTDQVRATNSASPVAPVIQVALDNAPTHPVTDREPASLAAPPAPTAQEWAFAAKYTLKNSKGYRYTWG